uniref:Reverse transcriptase domain-containing protein n=1 Tax=Leptobrachium leishanense TaxID=445787 RepID=A0A8C5Q7B2_9ANUR
MALIDFQRQKGEVLFLQETHFRDDAAPSLTSRHYPQGFYSNYTESKARGVAILVARHVPFTCTHQLKDPHGRYLFIKGTLGDRRITMANLYLPNKGQCGALRSILTKLDGFTEGILICGGDFNVPLDSSREGISNSPPVDPSLRRRFLQILHQYQLVDGWKTLHPSAKDYTFYSPVAKSYSRLDTFLIPHHHLQCLKAATIAPITWSDHAPVSIRIEFDSIPSTQCSWRLNESLLSDALIRQEIQDAVTQYFVENDTPEITPPLLWEAHKCVLRGKLIQIGAQRKRERRAEVRDLVQNIHILETSHKQTHSLDVFKELTEQRAKLTSLLSQQSLRSLQLTKRLYYSQGNKCGRLLANALKQRRQTTYIPRIQGEEGKIHHLTSDITATFHKYFSSLYCLRDSPPSKVDIRAYLKESLQSSLPPEVAETLEAPFTPKELVEAIRSTATGKSPGPDGFTIAYYKTFLPYLSPHLLKMINSLDDDISLDPSTLRAHIALIPKPDKDHTQVTNYRPISLLNADVKLMAKMMATRLNPLINNLVHPDQTGFIPSREARDNTQRAIALVHMAHNTKTPTLFLSIDAEKAFDRVDWSFLMETMSMLGFGPRWRMWIRSLYSNPKASLRVNGTYSQDFHIHNGTRQGCPLSPLLFVLTLEPLLQRIRDHPQITGFPLAFHHYKVAAYADDILLTLTNPVKSLRHLMGELDTYGRLSNFQINRAKCEVMGVGVRGGVREEVSRRFPFKWRADSLRYLGVVLPKDLTTLYKANYEPLLRKVEQDLKRWRIPNVSWLGRINIVKMNILPRFLYIFQSVPIGVPPTFHRQLKSAFLKYIWNDIHPRIPYAVMTRHRNRGGLGLPDLELYHTAALFLKLADWSKSPPHKLWVHLEQKTLKVPITTLPWQSVPLKSLLHSYHPLVTPTLLKWRKLRRTLALSPHPSPFLPVTHNPLFPEGMHHGFLPQTVEGPYLPLTDCIGDSGLLHIDVLLKGDRHTSLDCFRYNQIKHFLLSIGELSGLRRDETPFETLCVIDPPLPHTLSTIYGTLLDASSPTLPAYATKWNTELTEPISEDDWGKIFQTAAHASRSLHIQQSHYKFLSRWYLTPTRLHRIFPTATDRCWRCNRSPGTLLHIWWTCPLITNYWDAIFQIINEITDLALIPSPQVALFHLVPLSSLTYRKSLAIQLFNVAKAQIPKKWRSTEPPSITEWIRAVEGVREMEEQCLSLENKYDKYFALWYWWLDFLAKRGSKPTDIPQQTQ